MAFVDDRPQLIAHRGYSECYPENSLVGFEAALRAGADCIELDVQFSRDGVPVVIHDNTLIRTCGVPGKVSDFTVAQLATIHAGEGSRFGDKFNNEPIPTLQTVLELLAQWPTATAFVELKSEAIESFGLKAAVQWLAPMLEPCRNCVLISFHPEVPVYARRQGVGRVGWVIPQWDDQCREMADSLKPDVLFCDYKKIPDEDAILWSGPWQWALYDIVDPQVALCWIRRGVKFIETWDVGRLVGDPILGSCLGKNPKKT